ERHAVQHHRIVAPETVEIVERLAALDHVVLADRLQPIDVRARFEQRVVMLGAQAEAEAEIRSLSGIHRPQPIRLCRAFKSGEGAARLPAPAPSPVLSRNARSADLAAGRLAGRLVL